MEYNSKNHKKINLLIPKLLEQSNKYKKVFKNKTKLDNIFREFENKSSHHLKFFIKESLNRYKNMKLGNDLDKLMANSEKRRISEANRIITDNFFTDVGIKQEKKNLKNYTSEKLYKNLKKSFKMIKDYELENTKQFNKERIRKLMENKNSNFDEKKDNQKFLTSREIVNKGKKDINIIFENEENKIINMFDKYKKDVKALQEIGEKSQEKYASMHKKIDINLPKLEMSNYTHYEPPKYVAQDVEILQKKALKKILPFSKYNNIDKNNLKSKNLKLKKLIKKILLINKTIPAEKRNNKNNYIGDINDTNEVVYKAAYKELTASNSINQKRRKLNEILEYDPPKIDSYRNIIKNKYNSIQTKRNENHLENMKYQKYASMTYFEKMNMKIDNEIYLLTQVENKLFQNQKETK